MVKGVIFDFNGTLFFDNDKHVKAWGAVSRLLRNKDITDEELHKHFNGVPNQKIIQYMKNNQATKEDIDYYSKLKEKYYRQFCKEDQATFHLVEGSYDYFKQLKDQKIPFTIASASIKENIDFFVESFHLDKWMKVDDIIYDNGTYQNKIAMFKDAALKLNVNIKDCLIIEDSKSGIENAYEAGCRQIIVVNSANNKKEYEKRKPAHRCSDVAGFLFFYVMLPLVRPARPISGMSLPALRSRCQRHTHLQSKE